MPVSEEDISQCNISEAELYLKTYIYKDGDECIGTTKNGWTFSHQIMDGWLIDWYEAEFKNPIIVGDYKKLNIEGTLQGINNGPSFDLDTKDNSVGSAANLTVNNPSYNLQNEWIPNGYAANKILVRSTIWAHGNGTESEHSSYPTLYIKSARNSDLSMLNISKIYFTKV